MKNIHKWTAAILVAMLLCSCSGQKGLKGSRWYTDDINNTVRTVVQFDDKNTITVNYVLIDEGRAERTGVDGLKYMSETYYYKDLKDNLTGDILENADDTCAFLTYPSEEDYKKDQNSSVSYYHFDEQGLSMGGSVYLPVNGELGVELDEEIKKNMEMFE